MCFSRDVFVYSNAIVEVALVDYMQSYILVVKL